MMFIVQGSEITQKNSHLKKRMSFYIVLLILTVSLLILFGNSQTSEASECCIKINYFDQKPPGLEKKLFAPGFICSEEHEGCSGFTNDGNTFIFKRSTRTDDKLLITHFKNEKWSKPVPSNLPSEYSLRDFTFAPDGVTLFLTSRRPEKQGGKPYDFGNIWKTKWTSDGWTKMEKLPFPINTPEHHESYPSVTKDGSIYFFARGRGGYGKSDIFVSRKTENGYSEIENLGKVINTEHHEWDPAIAPDESFLIFCSTKEDSFGGDDLYVSFRGKNGEWKEPRNLGSSVNTKGSDNRPFISPDGKYLFWTTVIVDKMTGEKNREIYWISIDIIKK